MNNKTKNSIIILSLAAILILAFIVYFKLNLNKDIEYIIETKKNNFLTSEKIQSVTGLKSKSEEIDIVQKSFSGFYIDRSNILSFIELVENTAKNSGTELVIENVNVDEAHLTEPLPYGILNMTLTATGRLSSVTGLLTSLEKLPYPLNFTTVRLVAKGGQDNSDWAINIVITGITN
jgi:hypothetical protein